MIVASLEARSSPLLVTVVNCRFLTTVNVRVRWHSGRYAVHDAVLPSPVDRDEFGFVAMDKSGALWHWVDSELVWIRIAEATDSSPSEPEGAEPLH